MGAPGFVFTAIARPRSGRGNLLPKNGIAIKGDSQKVNCPNGAREATLGCGVLRTPRNDMLLFTAMQYNFSTLLTNPYLRTILVSNT